MVFANYRINDMLIRQTINRTAYEKEEYSHNLNGLHFWCLHNSNDPSGPRRLFFLKLTPSDHSSTM